jgi:hypothetical protein
VKMIEKVLAKLPNWTKLDKIPIAKYNCKIF